jgi:hypothetical protein
MRPLLLQHHHLRAPLAAAFRIGRIERLLHAASARRFDSARL